MPGLREHSPRSAGIASAVALACAICALLPITRAAAAGVAVTAAVETDPTHNSGDAADDAAIWIHPTDPSLSIVIGADKNNAPLPGSVSGLSVYDLSGHELHFYPDNRVNNVDVRYNFPLGSTQVSLVGATNRDNHRVDFWKVNPSDRSLISVGSMPTSSAIQTPRGFAMYHSPVSGKYYAFVTDRGHTDQYELTGADGQVSGVLVRQMSLPLATEGLVADDELARVYVAEETNKTQTGATIEDGGIMRYGAEPNDPTTGVRIDSTIAVGGNIEPDVKGLTLYYGRDQRGYVIAASQGSDSFHLYDRVTNVHVGEFRIVDSPTIDKVTAIDGADVTNFNLGPAFPNGVFVSQDDVNAPAPGETGPLNQNYKLVPWERIAAAFSPPLRVDPVFDPRTIGGSAPLLPPPPPPPVATSGVSPMPITSAPPGSAALGAPGASQVVKRAAHLRIARVVLRGRRLEVRGTLRVRGRCRVVVTFTALARRHRIRVVRSIVVSRGRYRAVLTLPRAVRRTSHGRLRVRYPGDANHAADQALRAISLRR